MTPEAQAIYDRADLMIVVGSRLRGNETRNNAHAAAAAARPDRCRRRRRPRATIRSICSSMPTPRPALDGAARAIAGSGSRSTRSFSATSRPRARNPNASSRPRSGLIASWPTRCRRASRAAAIRSCATSRSRTAPSAIAMCTSPRRISASMRSAAASGRASRWRSARRSPARRRRRSRCSATAAPWSISASSRPRSMRKADIVFVLMNDRGYGVIRNIQDAQFGGRRHYADLHTPDFALLCGGARLAASARVAHRGLRGRARPRAGGERPATGRGRHDGDRAVRRVVCRPAGGRGGKRVTRMNMTLDPRPAAAAAASRRGRGPARPRDRRAARAQGRRASQSRFLRHDLQRAGHAARLRSSRGSPGLPVARFNAPVDFSARGLPQRRAASSGRASAASRPSRAPNSAASPASTAAEFGDAAFLDRMTCYGNLSLDRHPLCGRRLAAGQRVLRRSLGQPDGVRDPRRCSRPRGARPHLARRRRGRRGCDAVRRQPAARRDPQLRLSLGIVPK